MLGYTLSEISPNRGSYTCELSKLLSTRQSHTTHTPSFERLEFLGDFVLDMIVTDYLYHAPGKNDSPGHVNLHLSMDISLPTSALG